MNIFRLCGDMLHLLSIITLLLKISQTKSCRGDPAPQLSLTINNGNVTATSCANACDASTRVLLIANGVLHSYYGKTENLICLTACTTM